MKTTIELSDDLARAARQYATRHGLTLRAVIEVLVYAHRRDSPWHAGAGACLQALAGGRASWAIPWPCLHEFLAINPLVD